MCTEEKDRLRSTGRESQRTSARCRQLTLGIRHLSPSHSFTAVIALRGDASWVLPPRPVAGRLADETARPRPAPLTATVLAESTSLTSE